jgi:putative FmdB family regulatory protein
MPTYDYRCDACEHAWEEFQSIKAEPTQKCPACGKKKAKRLIGGGAGLIFRGSGFYITDYRSDSYKKAAASDGKSSSGGDSGGGSSGSSGSQSGGGSNSGGGSSGGGSSSGSKSSGS